MAEQVFAATGRRKEAVARIRMKPGSGEFVINNRQLDNYFSQETLRMLARQPLILTNLLSKIDIRANVTGGGFTGQAGAIRHGVARALLKYDEALKTALRKEGFLTRDPRMKERKKYGQKGARARFQWTKR